MLSSVRARALADGLTLFAYEPCALPGGITGVLAGRSASAACRLGRAMAAYRCSSSPPASPPPKLGRGAAQPHACSPPPRPTASEPKAACPLAAANRTDPRAGLIAPAAELAPELVQITGCRFSCARASGRKRNRAGAEQSGLGRGLRARERREERRARETARGLQQQTNPAAERRRAARQLSEVSDERSGRPDAAGPRHVPQGGVTTPASAGSRRGDGSDGLRRSTASSSDTVRIRAS